MILHEWPHVLPEGVLIRFEWMDRLVVSDKGPPLMTQLVSPTFSLFGNQSGPPPCRPGFLRQSSSLVPFGDGVLGIDLVMDAADGVSAAD